MKQNNLANIFYIGSVLISLVASDGPEDNFLGGETDTMTPNPINTNKLCTGDKFDCT